ncbi:hypothetical protein SAMN04487970_104324 [Paenibacillus tianmuensis]|uniref:Uncharacterized protein n=1 Tax=Paenibacillus tianmuensis TaxID=624147 RepID=A0A1G4T5N4_9BACL|nr:hypothetical protein SAMN04487970_104324 [Paenibacillus tianmuensis]
MFQSSSMGLRLRVYINSNRITLHEYNRLMSILSKKNTKPFSPLVHQFSSVDQYQGAGLLIIH